MFRAKTQIWIGIALICCDVSLIWFEKIHWGYIEWKNNLTLYGIGPFIALQGYYRFQKQRNTPPKKVSEGPKIGPLSLRTPAYHAASSNSRTLQT
jgi:hypothetical protein